MTLRNQRINGRIVFKLAAVILSPASILEQRATAVTASDKERMSSVTSMNIARFLL